VIRTAAILLTLTTFAAIAANAQPPFDGRGTGPTIANNPVQEKQPEQVPPELLKWLKLPNPPDTQDTPKPVVLPPTEAEKYILPPARYDRPYLGELTVIRLASEADVTMWCPPTNLRFKLGCATHTKIKRENGSWTTCRIIMPVDSVIVAAGYTVDAVYRHEIAHCNGWGGDHKGARLAP